MNSKTLIKGSLNTIVRMSPVALYMGCIVSGLVFNNNKANYIMMGFFLVEMISFGSLSLSLSLSLSISLSLSLTKFLSISHQYLQQ